MAQVLTILTCLLVACAITITSAAASGTDRPEPEAYISHGEIIRLLEQQNIRIMELEQENIRIMAEMKSLERTRCDCPRHISDGQKTFDSPVAFTAGLSDRFTGGGDMALVPYDVNYLNHGDAFSFTEHHFTAPVRGLYWFTISIYTGADAKVILQVNGQNTVASNDKGANNGGAVAAMLMLEAGDRVTGVKFASFMDLIDSLSSGYTHNTLAGFLYSQL